MSKKIEADKHFTAPPSKAETTDAEAFHEIERQREAQAAKTERLRAQRLARDAAVAAEPKPAKAPRKRTRKPE